MNSLEQLNGFAQDNTRLFNDDRPGNVQFTTPQNSVEYLPGFKYLEIPYANGNVSITSSLSVDANGTYVLTSEPVANASSPTPDFQTRWPGPPGNPIENFIAIPGPDPNQPDEPRKTFILTGVIDEVTFEKLKNEPYEIGTGGPTVTGPQISFGPASSSRNLDTARIQATVTPVTGQSATWDVEYVWPFNQGANIAAPTNPGTYRGNVWYFPADYPNVLTYLNSNPVGFTTEMFVNQSPSDPIDLDNVNITYQVPAGDQTNFTFNTDLNNALTKTASVDPGNPRLVKISLTGTLPLGFNQMWSQNGYNLTALGNVGTRDNFNSNVTVTTTSGQTVSQNINVKYDVNFIKHVSGKLRLDSVGGPFIVSNYGLDNSFASSVPSDRLVKNTFAFEHLTTGPSYPWMRPGDVETFDSFKTTIEINALSGNRHTFNIISDPDALNLRYRIWLARGDINSLSELNALSVVTGDWTNSATQKILLVEYTPFFVEPATPQPGTKDAGTPPPVFTPPTRIDLAIDNSTVKRPPQVIPQVFGVYLELVGDLNSIFWPKTDNIYMPNSTKIILRKTDRVPTTVPYVEPGQFSFDEYIRTLSWTRQDL